MGLMRLKLPKLAFKPRLPSSYKTLTLVGVISAAVICVNANILVSRFYARWDWTSTSLYTLSEATRETLHGLSEPLDVVVFLSRSDPLTTSVRHMLTAYGAETRHLHARFVDPDRSPLEYAALQRKYDLVTGKTEDGRLVSDAAIVIARGDRHWFVTADDVVSYDEGSGRSRPRLEQALTEGIRNVLGGERAKICFSAGHREVSRDDMAATGMFELGHRLEKNNFALETVPLAPLPSKNPLSGCNLVIVAGPELPFSGTAAELLARYYTNGGNLLLFVNPILDDDNRIRSTGLEPVAKAAGIRLGNDFVVEGDASARLPSGVGETFFATPKDHAITKGFVRDGRVELKLLVSAAQTVELDESAARPSTRSELLETSAHAFALEDIRPFMQSGELPSPERAKKKGVLTLAAASELEQKDKKPGRHGPRLVAVGSANLLWSRNWREPNLLGNRLFVESAIAWLVSRPALVSVPEKASQPVGLSLTEESLSELWRYVLLYMPGAALLLGVYVILRRRSVERRSRRQPARARENSDTETPSSPD
jgi:hypothetical protein